jgi:hypothetical protein
MHPFPGDSSKTCIFIGEKWCAQGDDLRTFLTEFVAALPQIELPHGLNLSNVPELQGT